MTKILYHDAYLRSAPGTVTAHTEDGVILDQSLFYPTGGGQPGDTGALVHANTEFVVSGTRKGDGGTIVLILAEGARPPVGAAVTQELNWDTRLGHMRVHTALHLLSVVIPLPVTGGSISAAKGRLDFDMPEALADKLAVQDALNALIAANHAVTDTWITDAELAANPGLVKTMSVKPPTGAGHVRLVRIGTEDTQIDLQPCGGTHVAQTGEIGPVRIGKIEKKGAQNRRVYLHLDT